MQIHIPKYEAESFDCSQIRSERWLHLTEERAQIFRSSRQDFCAEGCGLGQRFTSGREVGLKANGRG